MKIEYYSETNNSRSVGSSSLNVDNIKTCPRCYESNPTHANYCMKCGQKLRED